MRLIDPTKTVTTREVTDKTVIHRREHFNGSVDANVHVQPLRLHLTQDAPPNKNLIAAVAELEAAQAEWLIAKHSPDPAWVSYAERRVRDARERVQEAT